jgi:hypothetical protein
VANPHLSTTLAQFEGVVHHTKDRLVSIPAAVQHRLGLTRRPDNHIVSVSVRRVGGGRWNHHLLKLTHDNEFGIPAVLKDIRPGDRVQVKVHRVIPDARLTRARSPAETLLSLAETAGEDSRVDGSTRIHEYLYGGRR